MKKANYILSGICIVIALYVIATALQYPKGVDGVPGPGVFPIMIAAILIAASVSIVISSIKMEDIKISWLDNNSKRVYISMVVLITYIIILSKIGFVITSILFMSGMVQWLKKGRPFVNVAISVVFVGLVYCVFNILLKVPMDFGILI